MRAKDLATTAELLRRVLEGEGWQVALSPNGRAALERLEGGFEPDGIVLDLLMPEMDGFEFLAHLRDRAAWRDIPVVVVTAKELDDDDRERLAGSVERVLQKGAYSKRELCDQLSAAVEGALDRR